MKGTVLASLLWSSLLLAQNGPTFAVASVKANPHLLGRDAITQLAFKEAGVSGKNLTLKRLITEAYDVQPFQVTGGPKWLDNDEYDIDARADGPASKEQLRLMLRALLKERFGLAMHNETKELGLYELTVDKGGLKIQPPGAGRRFHGEMRQFANLLSVQLSIIVSDDPTKPGMASGAPVPVVDKTGLSGTYDFSIEMRPEPGSDMFVLWQRVLQDQLGLKLERRKGPVTVYLVDTASRIPTEN
ncbi:MAG TPA: TIGR03435 family protein [Bryobacteraceae bacterium]|nr:TIGR03435 family protein [Bryobacteraceae bacterium]